MSDRKADLNLLTGVKAWQLELITKDQLLEAFQTWTLDKEQTVTEILRNRQLITDADKSYLDRLARGHSQDETADLTQSIRSDADLDQLRSDLTRLSDADLLESLDATQSADTKEPAIGLRFMRIREHTKGGLGVVWLAKDCELHRDVAIKEIREDHANNPLDRQRFVLEAEITGGLEHPNIVPVYGMGKYADGRPYYAMRFIRGTSLRDAIDEYHHRNPRKLIGGRNSEIELRRLLSRFIDVCHAIAYAHSRLVLHRDLKPDNIMLGKFGETLVVDWGLADPVGQREVPDRGDDKTNTEPELEQPLKPNSGSIPTSPGQPLGTIGFMSPEQARGDIANLGRATDIYSLGATLYQMLTGAAPVRSRNLGEALEKIAAGTFPKPCELKPDVPKALEAICLKAMALSPDQRYATAHLLAEDIENWMADDPVSAFPDTRWQCAQRWLRKNRTWAQAGAISLLVISIAMSISAVLINRYRQTQLAASRMSELNAIFDKEILQPEFFQPNSLGNLKELLDQLEHLGATNTNDKYENLVSLFSRHLSELRSDQKFNAQRKADYDQQISQFQDLFGQRAQSVCEKWLTEGQSRYADWYTVFDAPEQDSFASLALAPNQFTVIAANKLGRTATEINPANETSIAPVNAADFRWSVSFDHTWCNSSIVGLNVMYKVSKSSTKASEYSFIIASLDANSSVIENREFNKLSPISAELIDQFSMEVQMIILRNGSQLRRKRIRLARTPIQMQCIRQANTLEFSISSNEENYSHFLKIEDPFALPQKPGTVGVFWPSNVVVQSMKLEQMSNPIQPNPMEEADEHYNQSRFLEALTLYEKMPASPEVNYKKALAFAATNRQAEHDTIINELVSDLADASDANRRWSNLAGLRYLASLAAKKDMSLMREVLQNWRITDEQLASIPQTEREVIFQEFGKVGLRFRVVFKTEDDIKSLETRTSIINQFSEDEVARRNTLWRLADCYRIAGRIADAKQILEDLANNQWRNTANTFLGFRGAIGQDANDWQVDFLAVQPLERELFAWDEPVEGQTIYGVIGHWRGWSDFITLEPFYLALDQRQTAESPARRVHSPGLRAYGTVGHSGFDYDLSIIHQFGRTGSNELQAWGGTAEIGYRFDHAWKPRLSAFYGYASGDQDPADGEDNRFEKFYGFGRPWSANDYIVYENIRAPKLRLELTPTDKLRVDLGYSWYFLASDRDRFLGAKVVDPSGRSGDEIGHEFDIRARWQITRRLELIAGYAFFTAGEFTERAIRPGDTDFAYIELNLTLF